MKLVSQEKAKKLCDCMHKSLTDHIREIEVFKIKNNIDSFKSLCKSKTNSAVNSKPTLNMGTPDY